MSRLVWSGVLDVDGGVEVAWIELLIFCLFTGMLVRCFSRLVWSGVLDVDGGVEVVWVELLSFRFFTRMMVLCVTLAGFDVGVG